MRLLQINVSANWGSHGKIAEAIGKLAISEGWESMIAYGRFFNPSKSSLMKIGSKVDIDIHGVTTRLFDGHGLASKGATKHFINRVSEYNPDIIHLHNIHGYYLNYPILFDWLKKIDKPVVWTLHDCWPWTGHCAHYTFNQCRKWKDECKDCPALRVYPSSYIDRSNRNFNLKKISFQNLRNLTLVPVSNWIAREIQQSFLKDYPVEVIHNGIDLNIYKPSTNNEIKHKLGINQNKLILGVASVWSEMKGFNEFLVLRHLLPSSYIIVLVGLTEKQIKRLPDGIIGIARTNSQNELVQLYSSADVFANPTLEDNFPTTNVEALACGTPVITYNTGGSPEAIDKNTGIVLPYNDIYALKEAIEYICENKPFSRHTCRERAELHFNQNNTFAQYISLYKKLLSNKV